MPEKVSLSELKKIMGDNIVNKLYDEFAGMIIYIPKKGIKFPNQKAKEQYIFNCFYESNVQISEIAERVDLSEDRIRKILDKKREEWIEQHRNLARDSKNN